MNTVIGELDKGSRSLMHSIDSSDMQSSRRSSVVRRLNVVDGIAIVVGIIIGSGIFSSPGLALERAGSPGVVLIAWAASGLLVMLASQCYMELGGMMPSAGGDFDYLTRAYGERMGFAFAWFNIFVSKTGSQAIIATIFGRYFESVVRGTTSNLTSGSDEESSLSKLLAVFLITLITLINCAGVKESAYVSLFLTITKVSLVLSVFIFALVYASSGDGHEDNFIDNLSPKNAFKDSNSAWRFGSAMVACLWCYDGFADGNFLLEEMINPERDLPRIIRAGLLIVTACYLLINVGYLSVLSRDTIIDSKAIAVEFGNTFSTLFESHRGVMPTILAMGVSLSTMGSINGSIMTGGRAFYAVARAKKFPAIMAKINRYGAPYVSLCVQGVWAIVLLLLPGSNFSTLLDYFGPTSWIFYAFSASSVIILRYKEPETVRPFKVMWYPLPPLLVILIALVIFISSMMSEPLYTLLAIGFVVLAFPVHLLMEYYEEREAQRRGHTKGRSPVATEDDDDDPEDIDNDRDDEGKEHRRPRVTKYTVLRAEEEEVSHRSQTNSSLPSTDSSSLPTSNPILINRHPGSSTSHSQSGYSSRSASNHSHAVSVSGHSQRSLSRAHRLSGHSNHHDLDDLEEVEIDLSAAQHAGVDGRTTSPGRHSPLSSSFGGSRGSLGSLFSSRPRSNTGGH